jgi:hypothetical protein
MAAPAIVIPRSDRRGSAIGLPGEIFPQVHDGNQEPGLGAQAQNMVFSPLFLWFGSNALDCTAIDFRVAAGNPGHWLRVLGCGGDRLGVQEFARTR